MFELLFIIMTQIEDQTRLVINFDQSALTTSRENIPSSIGDYKIGRPYKVNKDIILYAKSGSSYIIDVSGEHIRDSGNIQLTKESVIRINEGETFVVTGDVSDLWRMPVLSFESKRYIDSDQGEPREIILVQTRVPRTTPTPAITPTSTPRATPVR